MKTTLKRANSFGMLSFRSAFLVFVLFLYANCEGNGADNPNSNEVLLDKYVQSKGVDIIDFNASNIKRFWIDNSVFSENGSIVILLKKDKNGAFESVPLKIQLANVSETQDCRLEVISDSSDFSYSVYGKQSLLPPMNISSEITKTSSPEENYLHYKVASCVFHLEDTRDMSFILKFHSKAEKSLAIKRIVLSFSENKKSNYLVSPGIITITGNDVKSGNNTIIDKKTNSFSVSGKNIEVFSTKKVLIKDLELTSSVTIKNIGNSPSHVYFGYAPFTKKHQQITNRNIPYEKNSVFKILSSKPNSNKIIVDSYPEWENGCTLVLNAKEDLSDFPNFAFIDGKISDVKKIDNEHTEITLNKPLKTPLTQNTIARIQSPSGAAYIYTNHKKLAPGEEITFSAKIKKDDDFFYYSPEAFCRGTYFVIPLILSNSTNKDDENTIMITDFTVSY